MLEDGYVALSKIFELHLNYEVVIESNSIQNWSGSWPIGDKYEIEKYYKNRIFYLI